MATSYPAEFRRKVLDLLDAGRKVADVAADLGVTQASIYIWRRQHLIDTGRMPGLTSSDHVELVAARKRIAELDQLAVTLRANELLKEAVDPKGGSRRSL